MKKSVKKVVNKKRSYLPLILLGTLIFISIIVLQFTTFLLGHATSNSAPQNVAVSNVSPNSFTVTFTTPAKTQASIAYSEDSSFGNPVSAKTSAIPSLTHLVYIPDLKPGKNYNFEPLIDDKN